MSYPRYICTICNYVAEGPDIGDELAADFTCPTCGAAKEAFEGCACKNYVLYEQSKTMPLGEIVNNIEAIHHGNLREQFPRIARLVDKVTALHGDKYAHLHELKSTFDRLQLETIEHITHEDGDVFYGLLEVARTESAVTTEGETLDDYLDRHKAEHGKLVGYLTDIKELTDNFRAPADACPHHKAMLFSLQNLDNELGRYVAKENSLIERLKEENSSVLAKR